MPTDQPTHMPDGTPAAESASTVEPSSPAVVDATPAEITKAEVRNTDATPIDATPPPAPPEGDRPTSTGEAPSVDATSAPDPAAPVAATNEGQPAKKKRRRRRKRKNAGATTAASPDGATGTPGEAHPEGDAEGEAGDDEGGEGDDESSATEPSGAPSVEGGEVAADGEAPAGEKKGKRPAKKKGGRPHPQREKPPFAVGEEVAGKITKVMDEALMIDVAGKALGIFDRKEAPESEVFTEGERIIGKVSNDGARGGLVVLTRDLNRWQLARTEVEAALAHKQPIDGLITGVIKGGVEVDVKGLRGFAPASHVELRLGADLHHLIGQRFPFEVVQFAKRGREFVLSRRSHLEETAKATRAEALKNLQIGAIVKGVVRSVTQFGAFIDVGGVDGLVHVTEASHTGAPLSQVFKVGDETEVKIVRVDEKGKVWLSRKAAEHDPWEGAAERYARGTRHKGKIVRLQPFGAFIELEPGIDGLMHVSDIASAKRFHHPSEVMKVGDEIEIVVAQSNIADHKIGLHPAPKEGEAPPPGEKPPPRLAMHQAVKCVVEAQEINGLVVRIVGQTGRTAKAYITAMATGTAKGTDLRRAFPIGKELDAKIIELDPRRGVKLSIKALAQDQERQSFKQYQNEVKQASKFGTFGDLLLKKGITK